MENNNGKKVDAANEALEKVGHVGVTRAKRRRSSGPGDAAIEGDEEVGDVQRTEQRRFAESVARKLGEGEERTVADSGRVEPPS